MRTLFSISIALIAPLVACRGGSGPSQTPSGKPGKHLIQVSGHLPTIDVVLANRAKLEQTAYDGIVVALQAGRQVFTTTPLETVHLAADQANVQQLNDAKLTENFLLIRGSPGSTFDAFDDVHWAQAEDNIRTIAQLAKLGQLRGIAFDAESYTGTSLFTSSSTATSKHGVFASSTRHCDGSAAEFQICRDQVRKRGSQFMSAIQEEYAGSKIFFFGGMSSLAQFLFAVQAGSADAGALASDARAAPYDLFPAFLNGMLDVIDPGMELIDGCEVTYWDYQDALFAQHYQIARTGALPLIESADRQRYADQVTMGMAVYLDASFALTSEAWNLAVDLPVGLLPQFFEYQVYSGLLASDRYLWVYWEKADWWTASPPEGAEAALEDARFKVAAGQPLGLDVASALESAAKAHGFPWQ